MPDNLDLSDAMIFLKDAIQSQFFMETIILGCWAIWKTRNALIFYNIQPHLAATRAVFASELKLISHRI
jgi:hypothetical protein